jgi:hypothetical protein
MEQSGRNERFVISLQECPAGRLSSAERLSIAESVTSILRSLTAG